MHKPGLALSLILAAVAFAADRLHKFAQVSWDCVALAQARCIDYALVPSPSMANWTGGELVPVTDFFNYMLVWNTGISYGLLGSLPAWAIGLVMLFAVVLLLIWWWRTGAGLVRAGLALCIGGALSNGIDRLIYGAVADFFHFHWQEWSFYIFNIADVMITIGVGLLILDVLGVGRKKPAAADA